jgi:hypothetical protein
VVDDLQVIGYDGSRLRGEPGSPGDGPGARGRVPRVRGSSEVGAFTSDLDSV